MRRLLAPVLALALVPLTGSPARAMSVKAVPAATGLAFPATFAFTPRGAIFYGERFSGEIRIFRPATGADSLFFTLPNVATAGEQGLLGLAVHPRWPSVPYVYAYYTRTISGAAQNVIVRLRSSGGVGGGLTVLAKMAAGGNHNGGVIRFGPDGYLYAVIGDVGNPATSQNTSLRPGKVLRLGPGGAVPSDNPFGNLVFSFGHRNMFGFDFDPANGRLWVSENGPACTDEVNLVTKGGNYAWGPNADCNDPQPQGNNQDGPLPRLLPETHYTPPIAPTGAAFCKACGLAMTEGALLVGTLNTKVIRRLVLNAARDGVASDTVLYTHPLPVLAVEASPTGSIYFSDINFSTGLGRILRLEMA